MLHWTDLLSGFQIPREEEHLIVTLFADDTTIYLRHNDDIGNLFQILDKWCIASEAKFNIAKTIVLLIGTPTYRKNLITNWRSAPNMSQIDNNIHIAEENEPIWIIGGWIGNGIDDKAVWSKNMDKIDHHFETWGKSNPSIFSWRTIIQIFGGGVSQYMDMVQGMPRHIENLLQKKINKFIWGGREEL